LTLIGDLELAVDAQLANRSRIVAALDGMLDDTTLLKTEKLSGHVEEQPVPTRVCDEAYMLLRRLLAREDTEAVIFNRQAFLDMTDEERDAEIERLRTSHEWTVLIETDGAE
jgi:hypothetical protein